ncbi:hypothetical protein HYU07_04500 [Candidatus Woesearchaeota archaeon]|nr:hypothetical protein [Candidatus Woesearchaeota archaeon]
MNYDYVTEFGKKLREEYLILGKKDCLNRLFRIDDIILLETRYDGEPLFPVLKQPKTICKIVLDETIPCLLCDTMTIYHPNLYLTLAGRGPFAQLLGSIDCLPALPYLNEALNHDLDPSMRGWTAEALGLFGKRALPLLNSALKKEENEGVITDIASSMLFLADESSLPSLIEKADYLVNKLQSITNDEERFDHILLCQLQELFKVLSYIKHPKSLACLKYHLHNENDKVSWMASRYVRYYEKEVEQMPKIIAAPTINARLHIDD